MGVELSVVVPIYNEEAVIDVFFKTAEPILKSTNKSYEFICVDDGSKDNSFRILCELARQNKAIKIVKFSKNFNKESAVTAGLNFASGKAVIVMDADLQHPPELIPQFIDKWQEGYDVVYGNRINRKKLGLIKNLTARMFYYIHNKISKDSIEQGACDFRLMDRKVVNEINKLKEKSRFMKVLMSWVGFKTIGIDFEVPSRAAGTTKWNYWKLWNFAIDGLTA